MKSITIDQKSIEAVAARQLDLDSIVNSLTIPQSNKSVACVEVGEHGYLLSRAFQPGDGLLTISLQQDGPLTALAPSVRQETLSRLLRCATLIFTGRSQSIPVAWRPYHLKNRIAFQADRRCRNEEGGRTDSGRILTDVTKDVGPRAFAFYLDQTGSQDLTVFTPNTKILAEALAGIQDAVLKAKRASEPVHSPDQLRSDITLGDDQISEIATHISFSDWYNSRLTINQRRFVDHPLTSSVRLVGPAGSGKTIALVVKCLSEIHTAETKGESRRLLFLTHASSTASAIENLVLEMDPTVGLNSIASQPPSLVITTLYSLANAYMRYNLDDLTPVSLDGHDGRLVQADILNDIIADELRSDWITFRSRCSRPFIAYMEADRNSAERRFFLWELLNEFACVLDAEGVRSAVERREKYLGEKRKAWMLILQSREEREVVLRLYDKFRAWLRQEKLIGSDQMIADFLNYLDSYRWEATRKREGFDAIFVDELHLFNRQERMLLRHLLRDPEVPPAVFMAYDAKQSPRDTFLGISSNEAIKYDLWRDIRLGKTEKIELIDVFRYSPQITSALSCIDQSFPGQDLDADWPAYSGISKTNDGPIPLVCELTSTMAIYGVVFKRATDLQHALGKDKRVAVLCCSYELFKKYLDFPELRNDYYAITSREEAIGVPITRKKFLFSMPEYVAGLQYDTVLLIDVNRGEVPDGPFSAASLRKFASQVYLGASRAERKLEIFASTAHGGIAPLLSLAIVSGAIKRVEAQELPRK